MKCEKVVARLSEYYDGELPADLAEELRTHLKNCKTCECELNSFAAISEVLNSTDTSANALCAAAPSWEQFASRLDVSNQTIRANNEFNTPRKLALMVGIVALAASIFLVVSLTIRSNPGSVAHNHDHTHTNNAGIAIDFEKLLGSKSNQPIAALNALNTAFEGREAAIDESESELGYKPSISQALPSGVKLVSNHILKLPQCNCAAGECSCGPAGCNCAASLCKRVDGSEFLVVEHCETQNVSFGNLKSELLRDANCEMQLMNTGTQLVASWITDHRRLTAIGLNGKAEAREIATLIASR